jgi:predicted methyltransferase
MKNLILLCLLTLAVGCSSAPKVAPAVTPAPVEALKLPSTIDEAVNSSLRSEANRKRDQYRHPAETLAFFGLKPEMTVVEISPSGGWYLEILAPLLSSSGHYIAAIPPAGLSSEANSRNAKISSWKDAHPQVKVSSSEFDPPAKVDIASPGSADLVLTFRNVHNWMSEGTERAAFQAFYKALKPGGVLGIVEHRANPKQKRDKHAKSGYVREKDIIELAKSVGFKLDSKSEINANPKDSKNYSEGVWTLPPSLKLKDKDRERYLAIGESDRMTLKFVKP